MTSPYIQSLLDESKRSGPTIEAPTFPVVGYDESRETLGSYLGDLASLSTQLLNPSVIFRKPVGEGRFVMFTNQEEEMIKQKLSNAYNSSISYLTSPDFLRRASSDLGQGFSNAAASVRNALDSEEKGAMIGQMVRGLLKSTIEAPLTLLTGKTIVDGEVVDATSPEMVGSLFDTAGTAAMLGTYSGINKLGSAASSVRPGIAATRARTAGALAKNIGREYAAQVGAGVAYEAVANPDEFSLDKVTELAANPLVLAMSAGGGALRMRSANKAAISRWMGENAAINSDATIAIPSAKQIAVAEGSTLADATATVDALAISDNWLEAGINKLKKAGQGTFYVVLDSTEQAQQLVDKYLGDALVEKPTNIKAPGFAQSKGGIVYYFANDFDNALFQAEDLTAFSQQTGIAKNVLVDLKEKLLEQLKQTKTESTVVNGREFKFRSVAEVPLPTPKVRPRAYLGPNNTVLMSMNPLTEEMINTFGKSGLLPGQQALVNGTIGTFLEVAKNGKLKFRMRNGKFGFSALDDVTRMPGGDVGAWNRTNFTRQIVDDFIGFADANLSSGATFDQLLQRFGNMRKWTQQQLLPFEDLVYKTLQDRAKIESEMGPRTLEELADVNRYKKIATEIAGESETLRATALDKLDTLGYRIVPDGVGYNILTQSGVKAGYFETLDQLVNFANADFTNGNTVKLLQSAMPTDGVATITHRSKYLDTLIEKFKARKEIQLFRRPDRMAADILGRTGDAALGTEIAFDVNNMLNAIDASLNGIYKPLVKSAERVATISRNVSTEVRQQVTRALEQRSLAELASSMDQTQILTAETLNQYFKMAGGSEVVKKAFNNLRDGVDAFGRTVKVEDLPINVRQAVEKLQEAITNDLITDEKVLRYVDALESGVDMTADQYINTLNWDANAKQLYTEAKKFFADASSRFNIPRTITGYAPWITKWESIPNIYSKVVNESEFIHELQRLGLTEQGRRVTDINELVYRYLKTGVHHKAPVAGGGTAGELLSTINKKIGEAQSLGADIRPLQEWIQNIRGVPGWESAIEQNFDNMVAKIKGGVAKSQGIGVNDVMDVFAFTKLGLRPINGLRDFVSAYSIGSLYGMDVANSLFNMSKSRLRRINSLMGEGYLPQADTDAMLSRTGKGRLGKVTDFSMKVSLQPQSYKVILGNAYVTVYDKTMSALTKANGNAEVLVKELGNTLDSHSKPVQDFFLRTTTRDPVTAARFLASQTAYNIANKFGRINNPLAWQGSYGRIFGQFGSWSLNALTALNESIVNSRSMSSATTKIARLGAIGAGVYYGGQAVGVNTYNWLINPLGLVPHPGPVLDVMSKVSRGLQLITSPDQDQRDYGMQLLKEAPGGVLFWESAKQSADIMTEEGNPFKALGAAAGFKYVEE